jgi:hypothetical protein
MSALHRNMPLVMVVVGILVALAGYFADPLGLGSWGGVGWGQWAVIAVGALTAVNGVTVWAVRNRD